MELIFVKISGDPDLGCQKLKKTNCAELRCTECSRTQVRSTFRINLSLLRRLVRAISWGRRAGSSARRAREPYKKAIKEPRHYYFHCPVRILISAAFLDAVFLGQKRGGAERFARAGAERPKAARAGHCLPSFLSSSFLPSLPSFLPSFRP